MAKLSSSERNAINLKLREQPWYLDFFKAQHIPLNRVRLSDGQREQLTTLAAQHGMPLPAGTKFDSSGNVNVTHGFAGLPTWAKVAIGAGAALGTLGVASPGTLGAIFGFGGGGGASGAGATALGGGAGTAAGGGLSIGEIAGFGGAGIGARDIIRSAIGPTIGAITGITAARGQANLADRQAQAETDAAKYAADLQAKAAAEQLAFLKEQEAIRQKEFTDVQAKNLAQYEAGQTRLAPYRALGAGAVNLFRRPITVGSVMGMG